jgi:hypothetical protein
VAETGEPYGYAGGDPVDSTDPSGDARNKKAQQKLIASLCGVGLILVNGVCVSSTQVDNRHYGRQEVTVEDIVKDIPWLTVPTNQQFAGLPPAEVWRAVRAL